MIKQLETHLERAGLTNRSSVDYGTLATTKPIAKVEAYCSSKECCQPKPKKVWILAKKRLPEGTRPDSCPDCNHALLYRRSK